MSPKGTPLRNFRIDDDLWQAAAEVANRHEMALSEVLRRLVRQYVATEGANIEDGSAT